MIKRPLCVVGFPFAITMLAAFFVDGSTSLLLSLAALATGALLYLIARRRMILYVVAFSAAAAFAVYALYFHSSIEPFSELSQTPIPVEGLVTEVTVSSRTIQYTVNARFPGSELPATTLFLRTYGEAQAKEGDIIRCVAEISTAEGSYNLRRGIRARGVAEVLERQENSSDFRFQRMRLSLQQYFCKNLSEKLDAQTAGLVGAMVLKVGEGVDSVVYTHMNRSGVSHLVAISGLHFSIFSGFLLSLFRRISLPRRIPELLTLLAGLAFVIVTGFSASVMRAFVMFFLVMLGRLSFRRTDSVNSLGFALLLVCAIWPHWTQSPGLWLSAASTLGILIVGQPLAALLYTRLQGTGKARNRLARTIAEAAGISLGAYLFSMPILLGTSGWISLVALPANLLTAPFVTPLLLGGFLCALIPGSALPLRLVSAVVTFCTRSVVEVSRLLSSVPFAITSLDHSWKLFWLVLAAGTGLLLILQRPKRRVCACWLMICVLSFGLGSLHTSYAGQDRVELVTFSSTGTALLLHKGEAVVLGTPGPYEVSGLLRYLEFRQVHRISALVATDYTALNSGVLRLKDAYSLTAVIGPEDAYLCEELGRALKGVPVYSSGYATVQVLDCCLLKVDPATGVLTVQKAGRVLYKKPGEALTPLEGLTSLWEPVGQALYGECRYWLESSME